MTRDEQIIRTQYQLEHLKEKYDEFVMDTSRSIIKTESRLDQMAEGIAKRESQMDDLSDKLDKVMLLMTDGGHESARKGVITQTIDNSRKIDALIQEAKTWKRAAIMVGGIIGGLFTLMGYLFKLGKNFITG